MQHKYYLRRLRKRTHVTQTDIAHLLGGTERSLISKIETGSRSIRPHIIITYALLFEKSMLKKSLFPIEEVNKVKVQLKERLTGLLTDLEELPPSLEIQSRIDFFEMTLNNLVREEEESCR